MANTIQVKAGAKASLPTLNAREFGFATDTYELFIGKGASNLEVLTKNYVIDEDDMVSDSAVKIPTQQSVKAYVDAELDPLTNNSIANTLHRHSELVASDGSPDPAVSVDASGNVGIGTTGPGHALHISRTDANSVLMLDNTGNTNVAGIVFKRERLSNPDIAVAGAWIGIKSDTSTDDGILRFKAQTSVNQGMTEDPDMVINNGNVGIGTTAPGNPLAVNRSGDGTIVDFESADIVEGNIAIAGNTTSYNAFVGSHYTQLKSGQKELPIGAVVISTGEIIPCEVTIEKETKEEAEILIENVFEDVEYEENGEQIGEEFDRYEIQNEQIVEIKKPVYKKIKKMKRQLKANHTLDSKTGKIIKTITTKQNISPDVSGKEYFVYIDTTIKPADKAVYGVWLGKLSDNAEGMSFGQDSKPVYLIAQVGLFKIRVTDTNGNIEVGDFLETSIRPMEAQKQNSKQKESGTIAKALVDANWSTVEIDSVLGYKWKLIPCIF